MRRLVSFSAAVFAAYLALAAAAFWTAWRAPTHRWIGEEVDPILFIWYLRWLPFALAHGHDPLLTNWLNFPAGFNLMWNTSILFPALVLSPVTLLFGAVMSYNVLATLALALSGWCAYLAFRRHVRREAAAVGGLLYGFSSFMFGQASNHVHVTLAFFPPLVLLFLDEILVRQRRSPLLVGAFLGTATGLQVLTGEEIAAATALLATAGVALLALLHCTQVRSHLSHAARALTVAAAVALAITAYPLTVQLSGSQRVAGPSQAANSYVLDALELVVPTPRQELTFDAADRVGAKFRSQSEIGGYIGIPLLLLVAFVAARHRSDPLVRFAAMLGVLAVVLSLGPRPQFAGRILPIPLPWVVPQRLPVLENILPARLALFTFLAVALLVAVFVDRSRLPRAALAAVVVVAFLPLVPNLPYPFTGGASPPFFSAGAHQLPEGSVALVVPYAGASGGTARPMLWQAAADLRFRMPKGYVIHPRQTSGPSSTSSPLFGRLTRIQAGESGPPPTPAELERIRCALVRLRVETVAVGPMRAGRREVLELFRKVLGDDPTAVGGVELWPDASVAAHRDAPRCS